MFHRVSRLTRVRPEMRLGRFLTVYTLWTMIVYQGPLYRRVADYLTPFTLADFGTLGSVVLLQVFMMVVTLGLLGLLSLRLMQLVSAILLMGNAAALYFIVEYDIIIDLIIVLNVFATNTKTTTDLLHPALFIWVTGLGVLPALFVLRIKLVRGRRWREAVGLSSVLAGCLLWFFVTAYNWLWFDRHATILGGLVMPWNYVINTGIYATEQARARRPQILLPEGEFLRDPPPGRRELVVLVIGEAARSANFPQYGYERNTTPFTQDMGLIALSDPWSCTTYTLGSLACILTHEGSQANSWTRYEPLPNYLYRAGVDVIWRTNSSGEPRVVGPRYETLPELRRLCAATGDDCSMMSHEYGLLYGLSETLSDSGPRSFLVIHQGDGSHGPRYRIQYPPEFAYFSPVCETVRIQSCSFQELVNAYDNTIVYTDFILAGLIRLLDDLPQTDSVMIYVSDHGESLGENGVYLHGLPNALAPDVQRQVPAFVWMSDGFAQTRGLIGAELNQRDRHDHDFVFHSVLGAFGYTSPIYKREFDIFARP